jgi:hypothetical protein
MFTIPFPHRKSRQNSTHRIHKMTYSQIFNFDRIVYIDKRIIN